MANRRWTEAKKTQVLDYYRQNGHRATLEKFQISGSMLNRWKHANGHAAPSSSERVSAVPPAVRRNRAREAAVLLRSAMKFIETEIRAGASMRPSDGIVRLALAELEQIKDD